MDIINSFREVFGSRWTGVKFFFNVLSDKENCFPEETLFCEAVSKSWSSNNFLTRACTGCAGAKYVFGWGDSVEDYLIENLQSKAKIPKKDAASIVKSLPRMDIPPAAIGLNGGEKPDLLVAFLQPGQLMKLLSVHKKIFKENLKVELSNYASVCGNVAVNTYLHKKISLSFGCEDSRQYGGISRDKLIVGVPFSIAQKLV